MPDILLPKGMCLELRNIFKFWETSDNISETVQDRDIVTIQKTYRKALRGPSNGTIVIALE